MINFEASTPPPRVYQNSFSYNKALFNISSYCNMFGLRIFIEGYVCLQYMDTEYISKPDFSAGAQYCKNTYHSFTEKSLD